jgi:hypothetical protein
LEVDEDEAGAAAAGGAQLGVTGEQCGELQLEGLAAQVVGEGGRWLAGVLLGVVADGGRGPAARAVLEREAGEDATREALDAELAEVALEPADHDRRERLGALDRDAAGEADRVEDLEQGAEELEWPLWGVALRKRRLSKLRREVADRGGDVAVDRVLGRGGRGGDVGLVEDQEALLGAVAEVGEQRVAVLGAAD